MSVITEHDLKILEFDLLLEELASYCHYAENQQFAKKIRPLAEPEAIELQQKLTADALSLLYRRGSLPLTGLNVIRPYLKRAELDATLDCTELAAIMTFLRALSRLTTWVTIELSEDPLVSDKVAEFKSIFQASKQVLDSYEFQNLPAELNAVTLLLACLPEQPSLLNSLERAILDENNLADSASSKLAKIRQSISQTQNKVRSVLEKIIRSNSSALQDSLITQRNNRFVVPVKASMRQHLPGLVHDSSASSQTLFVEPAEVVELNNEIRELELEEAKEIKRILFELSQAVKAVAADLYLAGNEIRMIDFAAAKAQMAKKYRAVRPKLAADSAINLKAARHPFIDPQKVVPLDLPLDSDIAQLLITGPNTGGKTICLKTIALLQVMAQSGLHIPAAEGSQLRLYHKIMVDIGDEQSVKLNLSTFSAHMKKIITILQRADEASLVILDELGSGTDPSEGAALARAILETLLAKQAQTFASTHYRELKIYALETPRVENAACEFDSISMLPTYRLLLKAAGVSNAFTIAENLGLDRQIISLAKNYLTNENINFDRALSEVELQNQVNQRLEAQLLEKVANAEKVLAETNLAKQKWADKEARLKAELLQEQQQAYKNHLQEVEYLLQELKNKAQTLNDSFGARKELVEDYEFASLLRQELKSKLHQVEDKITEQTYKELFRQESITPSKQPIKHVSEVELNAFYSVPQLNLEGQAVAIDSAKGQITLQNKNMQIQVPAKGLLPIKAKDLSKEAADALDLVKNKYKAKLQAKLPAQLSKKEQENYSAQAAKAGQHVATELNIIGARYNDAEQALDQYLDQAVLSGLQQVRIVHGKGSGILRKMVQQFAAKDKRVKSFRQAEYGEGDAGVTVLLLK